ncbi:potassium channel, subfamily K, member 7 [Engraulis encrasicolus]|uniref:potassium channel, subfamily K, member 7 n=1 Tax=Engraulis encrasicolus TaxID=184585 RepID=UPI002FD093DC
MARCLESTQKFLREHAFLFLVFGYILFILFGGLIFMALEQSGETHLVTEVQDLRTTFLNENRCVQEKRLDVLLREVLTAGKSGVAVLEADSDQYNFDFTSSLFFVTTFLTTTGYGTTMPLSDGGRLFCILYCMLGIPVTLLLLSCLTHALLPWVTGRPVLHLQTRWGLPKHRAALLYACVLAGVTGVLFFLLPAAVLALLERDWSFLEALYFCFISLSTIGLGDYLPGRAQNRAARQGLEFATSCYLVVGLVVLLVVLETFWVLPQVQALVRVFTGQHTTELKGLDLDEMVQDWDDTCPNSPTEAPEYALPISMISPCPPDGSRPKTLPLALPLSDPQPPETQPQLQDQAQDQPGHEPAPENPDGEDEVPSDDQTVPKDEQ